MNTEIINIRKSKFEHILYILKSDFVFSASLILAIISCLFSKPHISYINFEVLFCLFNLMVIVKAWEELHMLDKLAVNILNKCSNSRIVSLVLILFSFFAAMLVTNDIALITLVPLAIIIGRKSKTDMALTIILQTLAANIGSSLTPIGNPQNLYIFFHYRLTPAEFFPPLGIFTLTGLIWLILLNRKNKFKELKVVFNNISISNKKVMAVWTILFAVIILSVFGIVDYRIAFILTVSAAAIIKPKLLAEVDYRLLATFICFFIFIGNLSNVTWVYNHMSNSLTSRRSVYFNSILLSQFISNVPCSIFLSKFTQNWRELLLGVNIGGMGTLIASLASVISYKLYIKENPDEAKKYLLKFTSYNIISLVLFTAINYIIFFCIL